MNSNERLCSCAFKGSLKYEITVLESDFAYERERENRMEWNINNSLNESKLYAVIILTVTGNFAFELVHCFQLAFNRILAAPCT